jgi:hypothetical protein
MFSSLLLHYKINGASISSARQEAYFKACRTSSSSRLWIGLQNLRSEISSRYESNYCADSHAQAADARFAAHHLRIECNSSQLHSSVILNAHAASETTLI